MEMFSPLHLIMIHIIIFFCKIIGTIKFFLTCSTIYFCLIISIFFGLIQISTNPNTIFEYQIWREKKNNGKEKKGNFISFKINPLMKGF